MTIDVTLLATVAFVYGLAGMVKGVVGFGLPTIGMGVLGAIIAPAQAAAILVLPTILTNVWQMLAGPSLRMLLRRLWPMHLGIIVASVAASVIISGANTRIATACLGLALIANATLGLVGLHWRVKPQSEPRLAPLIGLTTGVVNGATGVFMMPALPYLNALDLDRDSAVQAFGITAFVSSTALGVGLGLNGVFGPDVALPTLVGLGTSFAGMALGQRIRGRLPIPVFRRWVMIALLGLGASMVLRALL